MNDENLYDERYDNNYEDTEKNRSPWLRIVFIVLGIIVIILIILLLLRACGNKNKDLSRDLLEAGKEHYRVDETLLPIVSGECEIVTLGELLNENLITSPEDYELCDDTETYVKVCKLESGKYHYTPILACGEKSNEFGPWTIGDESNITPDKSDLRFLFIGEQAKSGTKYYYPGDQKDASKVKEYYIASPASGYDQKDNEVTNAFKWYTEKTGTQSVYWNNGGYSSTAPAGYPNKGESTTTEVKLSDTKPAGAEYRTINTTTQYRSRTEARPYQYDCWSKELQGTYHSTTICTKLENSYTDVVKIYYTCDGVTSVEEGTVCNDWSNWSSTKCTESIANGTKCESKTTYSYYDTMWKWYKTENTTTKSYYPSGSATATGENTYYVEAPIAGAIKDTATGTKAYKFYKVVEEVGSNENQENTMWTTVTANYVSLEELISTFQGLKYNVNSLKDIEENDAIRYQIQLQYRDMK